MYANRMKNLKPSFIREILKVTGDKKIISFAGGLPNPSLFPLKEVELSSINVSRNPEAMQYGLTEGYEPLREYIANRYYSSCGFDKNNILVTNGSQQALDLLGKLFIDRGDGIIIEAPGYLGAIQAFSVFEPNFIPVEMDNEGMKEDRLIESILNKSKFIYTVPNFQNPSGITYTDQRKDRLISKILTKDIFLIEDNPYGELYFDFPVKNRFIDINQTQIISLGSFSKIFVPAMRLGWVAAKKEIIDNLSLLKQAADLHTNYYSQHILLTYLNKFSLDEHAVQIRKYYKNKMEIMVDSINKYMPPETKYESPNGGMFIWLTLPDRIDVHELLNKTKEEGVIFVPGSEFYIDEKGKNSLRLNYSNSEDEEIIQGIKIIAKNTLELMHNKR